jgi:serpin B
MKKVREAKIVNRKILIGILAIVVVVAGVFLFNGYGCPLFIGSAPALPKTDDIKATQVDIKNIVKANNRFALEFYADLKNREVGKNIFFSPYSISTALAMTYEGSRGKTADEIRSVFHFPENPNLRRQSVAAVYNLLNREDAKHKLHTANALWAQKDYQLLNEFTEVVEKYYGGKVTNVDFAGATEEARRMINSWVEDQTNNKIKDLFPKNSLNPLTRLALTNAIYFKGNWVKQFEKNQTRDEDFRVSETKKVKVPMMRRTDRNAMFNYAETENLQILEMLYEGKELSMLVLLPKNHTIKSLEESLTVENLNQWKNVLEKQRVDVYIPKFTFDSKYFLNENLKEMGMPLAFIPPNQSEGADFSGISGEKDLYIQLVVHQAFIDVDEEGTEAAAATGVGIGIVSIEIVPVFRADRPFIFLIQERETGIILFMGRVVNPVA